MAERPRVIRLRPLADGDAAAWIALHADAATMARIVAPLDAAAAGRAFAAAHRANSVSPPRRRTWTIVADDRFAGVAGLVFDAPGEAELGAILPPAEQGRGVATRALALVVAHAFAAWPLRRIHTRHDDGHGAAAGLMRTLGFERVAAARKPKGWQWQCTSPPPARGGHDSLAPIG